MGCHFLLQGIFLAQELNPGLPHCRQTLYHLSHWGRGSGNLDSDILLAVNNKLSRDFPDGPVVRNLSSNDRDTGLIPRRRTKLPHASGQLSQCATTGVKPTHCSVRSRVLQLRPDAAKETRPSPSALIVFL